MPEIFPLLPVTWIDMWLGNETTRRAGEKLAPMQNESYHSYFLRWVAIKRLQLEWRVEINLAAEPGRQVFYRPLS